MLETFCLRLSAGLALSLLVLPAGAVSPRFYRTHLLVVLALVATAGVLTWNLAEDDAVFWAALGASAGLGVVAFWLWSAEGVGIGLAALAMLTLGLLTASVFLRVTPSASGAWAWRLLDTFSAAALLGTATTAMLMGHWYLIAPGMSIAPLLRLLGALTLATALRLLVGGVGCWHVAGCGLQFDRLAWLGLAVRGSVGLLMPLGLTWMAWQAARIRSTQSATGILYVLLIFVLFGELTDQILQEHLATLAGGGT
jgi:hypothetical protein